MKDVLVYILQQITLEPDKVEVVESDVDSQVEFTVTCGKDDIGRIIGKKGKVIKALRKVLSIIAIKEGKRVAITMADTDTQPESEPATEEKE